MIGMTIKELRKWVSELRYLNLKLKHENRELIERNQELNRQLEYYNAILEMNDIHVNDYDFLKIDDGNYDFDKTIYVK